MQPGRAKEPTEQERAARAREKRVEELGRRVQSGTYRVNADEVARAIVRKHIKAPESKE